MWRGRRAASRRRSRGAPGGPSPARRGLLRYQLIHTFSHTHIQSYTHSVIHTFSYTHIQLYTHSVIKSYTHSVIHTFSYVHTFSHKVIHTFSYIHTFSHTQATTNRKRAGGCAALPERPWGARTRPRWGGRRRRRRRRTRRARAGQVVVREVEVYVGSVRHGNYFTTAAVYPRTRYVQSAAAAAAAAAAASPRSIFPAMVRSVTWMGTRTAV